MTAGLPKVPANAFIQSVTEAFFIRLRQNTLQLAAGINDMATRRRAKAG